jgi:hypothetical protein
MEGGRGRVRSLPQHPTGIGSANGDRSPNGDRVLREVLELATVTTLIKGSTVYVLPPGEVPGGGVPPRVFRY